ncbi:MAG: hypothetical protein COA47_14490 [Robiginitomaculum sp.]|nr:MAG: hypothetical protein COA47_14490 [Robiginitomaculum sp.]
MKVRLERQFNNEHLAELARPARSFLSSKYACKFEAKDYIPGGNRFVQNDNGLNLNVWMPSNIISAEGDCSTIHQHFEYIFPDEAVRNHWLNYFASLVQLPSIKIKHCLLLIGGQGIGKSYFKHLLQDLLGFANVGLMDSGEWHGNFNAHLLNVQVVVIEELMASGRLEAYNELKRYLSEPFITANEKHVVQYTARTPYAFLAFSNHRKPILLENTDRRFHVYHTPVECQTSEYYDQLFNKSKAEIGAFLFYLENRDLANFSPNACPPMTEHKKELINLSTKPSHAALKDLIESQEDLPFQKDIITLGAIRLSLKLKAGISERALETNNLKEALLDLGAKPLGQIRINGSRPSLWIIRNVAKWKNALNEEIKAEFTREFKISLVEPLEDSTSGMLSS